MGVQGWGPCLTSGVSGERSAAERVHCTPGLGRYATKKALEGHHEKSYGSGSYGEGALSRGKVLVGCVATMLKGKDIDALEKKFAGAGQVEGEEEDSDANRENRGEKADGPGAEQGPEETEPDAEGGSRPGNVVAPEKDVGVPYEPTARWFGQGERDGTNDVAIAKEVPEADADEPGHEEKGASVTKSTQWRHATVDPRGEHRVPDATGASAERPNRGRQRRASAAKRSPLDAGLDAGDECGLQLFIASVADDCAVVRDLP